MEFKDLIALYELAETKHMEGPMDSALTIYSGPFVLLRYLRDRGQDSFDVACLSDTEEWFDVSLVKALAEKSETTEYMSPEIQKKFLLENLPAVKHLFSPAVYPESLKILWQLGEDRGKRMFPKL